ncbi:hypothetical protein Hypma_014783 [Hypsizygus marmoreus]|uniref:Uncharacterized protein n=1 Tax=Hypsizygus marmoreus TaxID=39966 RepID=A0A369JBJ6_HYPMA|nr:hypothetical protein Hypma_014783 [Hypsizygus marmoreus]
MDMSSTAQPPSWDALNADHSLLLFRMNEFDEKAIQPFDGLVGAVIEKGKYIVTSPNCKKIPYPPLSGDYPLWPQQFISMLAHLPLIRYPPRDPKDPLVIMWWMSTRDEFEWKNAVLSSLGHFRRTYIAHLRIPCTELVDCAHAEKYKKSTLALQYMALIPIFLNHLSLLPASLRTMQLLVYETQRLYLELLAIVDLIDIYELWMLGHLPIKPGTKVACVIGAFTNDLTVCADLQCAIIPAYLVRPSELIHTMQICEVVTAHVPEGFIPTEEHVQPTYRMIYRGPATIHKYGAMMRFTRNLHAYPNPFNLSRVEPRPEVLPSSFSLTNCQAHSQQYSSYARKNKPKSAFYEPQGWNKFEDLNDPIYPSAIPAWHSMLQNVDRSKTNIVHSEVMLTDFGYAFLELAMFVALEHRARRDACFQSWLRYCSVLIHHFSAENSDAQPMSGKAWHTLLSLDYIIPHASTSKLDQQPTKSALCRNSLRDFLQNCLDVEGVIFDEEPERSAQCDTWMGKDFSALEDRDFKEILWEMAELNF